MRISRSKRAVAVVRGEPHGRDPRSGIQWSFEDPNAHWAAHDARELQYWLGRPAAERLERADEYRLRVHDCVAPPRRWSWRFVDPFGHA